MDPLTMTFQIAQMDDLLLGRSIKAPKTTTPPVEVTAEAATSLPPEARAAVLAAVGFNTNLLPHSAVECDLITDSWSEIHGTPWDTSHVGELWSEGSTEQPLQGLYGYKYVVPVSRGRFAEALLCKALAMRPGVVATNSLFPTTRFHLESNGFTLQELNHPEAFDRESPYPFKGDLDLSRLKEVLENGDGLAAIYIEMCPNALGGHPISLANISGIRALAATHRVPVLVDGCRAFANAVLIRDREPGHADRSLTSIVRQISSSTDGCASSCAKDFQCRIGGFIGTNDPILFQRANDLTLAFGDGLDLASRRTFRAALSASPESSAGSLGRVRQVQELWKVLQQIGVPVVQPSGGHAVFVDACAMFPHIPPEQFPAQALVNALYMAGSVRGAVHFASPSQVSQGAQLCRLAIPVGCRDELDMKHIVETLKALLAKRMEIPGLKCTGAPPGAIGEFAAQYQPLTLGK